MTRQRTLEPEDADIHEGELLRETVRETVRDAEEPAFAPLRVDTYAAEWSSFETSDVSKVGTESVNLLALPDLLLIGHAKRLSAALSAFQLQTHADGESRLVRGGPWHAIILSASGRADAELRQHLVRVPGPGWQRAVAVHG